LHLLQGGLSVLPTQFTAFAKILAVVVFPTPLGPENMYACDTFLFFTAFFKTLVMWS
jgi:hypothetical protein